MSERPIIFSGPMVRAILDGRKTQTRRVIKRPLGAMGKLEIGRSCFTPDGKLSIRGHTLDGNVGEWFVKLPYSVGDHLYVREAWFSPEYEECGLIPENHGPIYYRATEDPVCWDGPWRPSIHMPKWAARIWLEVTRVRAERVQDISEEDATAEGITPDPPKHWYYVPNTISKFCTLWNSLNEKRGYGWKANSLVWVYNFKRIEK